MSNLSRRRFLERASGATAGGWLLANSALATSASKLWTAAIIGATGQGDYGHGLDQAFDRLEERVQVAAIADSDPTGRARAATRARAPRQYSDYRKMLAAERPGLVVVAPRWSENHYELALAALHSGAHVLTEKPFTVDLAEADQLLSEARTRGLRIAVAHQMRLAPSVVHLQRALADGLIGDIVQLRAWGKQDARAGGEDLIVLGTHLFDMMRLLTGDAHACTAQIFARSHAITRADAHPATERIGPIAGDEVEAQFQFAKGVSGSFTSRGRLRETMGPWALEVLGSQGAVRIMMDIDPVVLHRRRGEAVPKPGAIEEWRPLADDPSPAGGANERGFGPANRRVVEDWIDAIERDREPQCSGANAAKALEFVMAAYQAALEQKTIPMPMIKRQHPLV